jgi:hypothetical protein
MHPPKRCLVSSFGRMGARVSEWGRACRGTTRWLSVPHRDGLAREKRHS